MALHLLLIKGGMKTENGKVKLSTPSPYGDSPCLRGRKWGMALTVVTTPSHTGEGWGGVHTLTVPTGTA